MNQVYLLYHLSTLRSGDQQVLFVGAYKTRVSALHGPWATIGTNSFGSVMVVVWTGRGEDVRYISVRKAEPRERRSYEKGI
jgi:uncharacterized DUF497 family protein